MWPDVYTPKSNTTRSSSLNSETGVDLKCDFRTLLSCGLEMGFLKQPLGANGSGGKKRVKSR